MAQVYLCFLWHMHQPFYKDLLTGEYRLPWTRMHALKDYYGMVKMLDEFPGIRQTFNLVPSLLAQVEEYAKATACDPFLTLAEAKAETLNAEQRQFILQYFFQANRERLIYRYPRYKELYERWAELGADQRRAVRYFSDQDFRDLQVLSQLAWFDEEFLQQDPETIALVNRASDYNPEDQKTMARKQREILNLVIPAYRTAAGRGQIEISTTPFYHPILPLLCDSDIAAVAHPGLSLPPQFRHPEDAFEQLQQARSYVREKIGTLPAGLWPSEGAVSEEALHLASEAGFRWAASDQGVLEKTLQAASTGPGGLLYQPFCWEQDGRQLSMIFRDHYLSDLIGFVFSRMGANEAADDFMHRLAVIGGPFLAAGRDALIPIILDGENAWEYYDRNGRPFLQALYSRIQRDNRFRTVTVSEALSLLPAFRLRTIAPGSWINANFDIWIGAPEDNSAWRLLGDARRFFDLATASSEAAREMALRELLIAEGSDWCWWYGPEHETVNRIEFDQLFRDHLANVYRALGSPPPEELARPLFRNGRDSYSVFPSGHIRPVIDGEISSYFEWIGAGEYRADLRLGAMHGRRFLVRQLFYGTDGANFFLRVDFLPDCRDRLPGLEARLTVAGRREVRLSIRLSEEKAELLAYSTSEGGTPADRQEPTADVAVAFGQILEISVPLDAADLPDTGKVRFQFSLWHGGLAVDALPVEGWLEFSVTETPEWMV